MSNTETLRAIIWKKLLETCNAREIANYLAEKIHDAIKGFNDIGKETIIERTG